ncbi:MAG: HAMP domain-containing histidine kinase [Prolixibacteraceae bacterium]|nr:HAMP domain-containing histidine kinase [Prolixibacteraceae bacterium]
MKLLQYIRTPIVLLAVFLGLSVIAEKILFSENYKLGMLDNFNEQVIKKQEKANDIISKISNNINPSDSTGYNHFFETLWQGSLFKDEGIGIVVTHEDSIIYWSDQSIAFPELRYNLKAGLLKLPNGWYLHSVSQGNDLLVHSLVLIKFEYPIDNDFLNNRFAKGFNLPVDYKIQEEISDDAHPVFDSDNEFLFAVKPGTINCVYPMLFFPVLLYLLALLMFLWLLYRISAHFLHRFPLLKLVALFVVLSGLYLLVNYFKIPFCIYQLSLFSPKWFAFTSFWPSLGNFLLFSLLIFYWAILFYRTFDLSYKIKSGSVYNTISLLTGFFLLGVFFIYIRFLFFTLVMNSGISFAVYRIEELNVYSFYGFLALGFLLLAFLLTALKFIQVFRKHISIGRFFLLLSIVFIALTVICYFIDVEKDIRLNMFYYFISATCILVNRKGVLSHRLTLTVIVVFLFTLFSISLLFRFVEHHENEVQETMAINLSAEHDPTAELFLHDIDKGIKIDTLLENIMLPPFENIDEYLRKNHFDGYFREYDFQVTICYETDSLLIQPGNITRPCFPFFEEMIENEGGAIEGTNFYFMDNSNGRITYFGKYIFEREYPVNLYIELNSKLLSEGAGFPELLIPQNSFENKFISQFSFAKYSNGELVDRGGKFVYALSSETYNLQNKGILFQKWNGYDHCIYGFADSNFIIVSRKYATFYDYMIAFPYFFIFFFILVSLLNVAARPYELFPKNKQSLQIKIQYSIIGIVLVSLLIIGGGTIFYIVTQYRSNHQKELIERMNSVSIEVETLLDKMPTPVIGNEEYLNYELIRLSDVFRTDIHLYSLNGNLMATSRPEIFEKGLISPMMNREALMNMALFRLPRYLHNENISKMKFLSAYIPLLNEMGEETGYLNLPYFMQQKEFSQQITTFVLAFINIYVFLLLASILVAYFISAKITGPLKLIRDNLQSVQLGKNPLPIRYTSNDEIGALVTEYNNKVEELAASADLLARSERETAWREMARQIAHEIKNPLTPMKLNIQFLQRSKPDGSGEYQKTLEKVTKTLIEQIDNLSAIATEFSNFAKMPRAHSERFNLMLKLKEIVGLYDYTDDCKFETRFEGAEDIVVNADREQFSRAMINLIKNAQQAMPENREGKITFSLYRDKNHAVIEVSDNGKGIPDTLKERIFMPNFTTKSSGTGLGLAITKNITDSFGGEIWFESEEGKGSTFYVKMPIAGN